MQTVDWRGILIKYLHLITRLHGLDHLGEGIPDHVDGITYREAEALAQLRDEARKQWKESRK